MKQATLNYIRDKGYIPYKPYQHEGLLETKAWYKEIELIFLEHCYHEKPCFDLRYSPISQTFSINIRAETKDSFWFTFDVYSVEEAKLELALENLEEKLIILYNKFQET